MDDALFDVSLTDEITAFVYSIYEEPVDRAVGIFEYSAEVDDVEFKKNGEWVGTVEHEKLLKFYKEDLAEALVEFGKRESDNDDL